MGCDCEVSAAAADLFGARTPRPIRHECEAALFHEQLVHAMTAGAGAWCRCRGRRTPPRWTCSTGRFQALFGRPLIGDGAQWRVPGQPGGPALLRRQRRQRRTGRPARGGDAGLTGNGGNGGTAPRGDRWLVVPAPGDALHDGA